MKRVAFISDIDTPLGFELARCYIRDENRVFATTSSFVTSGKEGETGAGGGKPETGAPEEREEEPGLEEELQAFQEQSGEALSVEKWNRSSPISAKSMFLKALNRFETLDEVLLLGDPPLSIPPLDEVSYEMIERTVDCWIKGNLFLLKNVIGGYLEANGGTLALVNTRFHETPTPLEEAIQRSFMGLTRSLLTAYSDRGINIVAFESTENHARDFAGYIYRNLTDKGGRTSGRWLRYKKGIFGGP
jgi:hypothetical protein